MHRLVCLLLLSSFAAGAAAHEGHAESFVAAFAHPFVGWDHLLAALLIGVLAARTGAAGALLLPTAFAGGTAAGITLALWFGQAWLPAAWLEPVLASTVVLFGLAVAFVRAVPIGTGFVCMLLGLAHGAAHGAEVPSSFAPALGLVAATASLHAAGYVCARAARGRSAWLVRGSGAAAALVGLVALAAPLA